jgi:hypothetical protein
MNKHKYTSVLGSKCTDCTSLPVVGKVRCSDCQQKRNAAGKDYYVRNKDKIRQYLDKTADQRRPQRTKYLRKYFSDINNRLAKNLRARIRLIILRGRPAIDGLGCTIEQLKIHIEKQFVDTMSWDNYGYGHGKWNIDHIRPLSSFDLTNKKQLAAACHHTNLQPLWHSNNSSKGAKWASPY